jgi:nicotinamide riboside transporter PnuC
MGKETFVRFYREEIFRAQLQKEIYSYKLKTCIYVFGWRIIHLYTYKENRVEHESALKIINKQMLQTGMQLYLILSCFVLKTLSTQKKIQNSSILGQPWLDKT